jgi:1,4-dihydroxy-6-naphthoate synthase
VKIRAAISPCPNDVFIFAGLIEGAVPAGGPSGSGLEFDFEFHELETLNLGAQEGRWDLAKISYANYASCAGEYRLLRCGGALGRGCGPLLLSNREGFDPAMEVLVPGRHTTANFLLDFYGRRMVPPRKDGGPAAFRKVFMPFDELYRRLSGPAPCQGVVIHEMRFTYAADGLRLIRDLGEFWETATGYPIPLGAVAHRRGLETARPGLSGAVEAAIRKSLDWSYAHPAEALAMCRKHSQSMSEPVLQSHIDLYVNSFTRDIGTQGDAAVEYFLSQQRATL